MAPLTPKSEPSLVVIIDDHPLVLQGCARLLEDERSVRVLQYARFADGYRHCKAKRPQVVITDLSVGGMTFGGISFVRRLRLHDKTTPVLVLSMHSDPLVIRRALEAGATGYVAKHAPADELLAAFDSVRDGKPYVSYDMACELSFSEAANNKSPLSSLSVRELQTLSLVAEGKPYGAIADELGISYKTVANTASQIKTKLGARSLPELMRIAIQHLPGRVSSPRTR